MATTMAALGTEVMPLAGPMATSSRTFPGGFRIGAPDTAGDAIAQTVRCASSRRF
jgi:hypothetical protein